MTYKVIQWATGEVGSRCLTEILRRPELELVGLLVYSQDKEGRDAGDLVGAGKTGVIATCDKEKILAIDADCVIHAPLASSYEELDEDVIALLASGKNVISAAGYFAPEYRGDKVVAKLEEACNKGQATLMGAGVEPGFMFERVAPTLSGMCTDIESLRLVESIDAANHPAAMMLKEALNIGKPVDSNPEDSPFAQYFKTFFSEMATAAALPFNVRFDEIESGMEVAPASRDLDIAIGTVPKGSVAGSKYWVNGVVDGKVFLRVEVYWFVEPGVNGWPIPDDRYQWKVEIQGRPSVRMVLDAVPSLDGTAEDYDAGFHATMAVAINAVPEICEAAPGIFHQPVFATWKKV